MRRLRGRRATRTLGPPTRAARRLRTCYAHGDADRPPVLALLLRQPTPAPAFRHVLGGGIPINPLCLPPGVPAEIALDRVVDGSSVGAVVGPLGSGVEAATIHRIEGTAWSEFGGFWGETEYFFTPVAIGPFPANSVIPAGPAPSSPANQSKWNPAVVLGWPSA